MTTKRALAWILFALLIASGYAPAQDQQKGRFESEVTIKVRLDYLLFVPEATEDDKLPMIVFLHGAGERGGDLEKVKTHGPPKIVEKDKGFPFIVLSPQCGRRQWWRPEALAKLIDRIIKEHPVDEDRIYLTGLSMGGYGTWALAAKYPQKFAAIAPICGGGNPESAASMKSLPVWVFHGAKDPVVRIDQSQRMVDALKAVGNPVKFTVYPDAGHDSWTETYDNPELYQWFLTHRRSDRLIGKLPTVKPEEVGLSSAKLERITSAVGAFIDRKEIAGAVTVVARRGRVVYAKASGRMDLEAAKDMKLDTIFRIYSMTKPITSVAAMILHEEGKFQLDDAVSKYLPEFKGLKVYKSQNGDRLELEPPKREMTVRDLLRHTSGLTYGFVGNTAVDRMYRRAGVLGSGGSLKDMAGKLRELPLLYHPGTKWNYSVSVDVLGYLVEVLSGKPLDEFFEERIFRPLGMKDTGFHVPESELERFAANYGPGGDSGLRVIDAPATSRYAKPATFFSGGGGLVSTAEDYLRFCQMLVNGGELGGTRILRRETVEDMTSNHLPEDLIPIAVGPAGRPGIGFGLGFSVRVSATSDAPWAPVGEYGWGGAASTHFWVSPRDELVVVALSQYMPFSDRLQKAIKPIVYGAMTDRPQKASNRRELQPARD